MAVWVVESPFGAYCVTVLVVVPSVAAREDVVSQTLPLLSDRVLDVLKPASVFSPVTLRVRLLPSGPVRVMVEV